ncbi:MAG: hypothetical protein AAF823_07850 [Planctomycetota bacterium]
MKSFHLTVFMRSVAVAVCALAHAATAQADIAAYREIFNAGPNAAANGWSLHIGADARDQSEVRAWGNAPGATREGPVNSASDGATPWKGFLWNSRGTRYALFTQETTIHARPTRITWHMSPGADDTRVRVILRVDANGNGLDREDPWFASDQVFAVAGDPDIRETQPTELTMAGSAWRVLDFAPGSPGGGRLPATPGASAELPEGPLVGFGWFVENRTQTDAFDTFTIHTPNGPTDARQTAVTAAPSGSISKPTMTPFAPPAITPLDNDYQFERLAISGGGYFTAFHVHPADPDRYWARSDMIGPFRRDGQADRWRLTTVGEVRPKTSSAEAMALHPTDPNIVYAAFGLGRVGSMPWFNAGLYRSDDGGETWRQLVEGYAHARGGGDEARKWNHAVAVDPRDPDTVYWASRRDGLFRTTNGGETFTKPLEPREGGGVMRSVAVDPSRDVDGRSAVVYVAQHKVGLFRSTDGGVTFELVEDTPGDFTVINRMTIANDGTLWVSAKRKLYRFRHGQGWIDATPRGGMGPFHSAEVLATDSSRVVAYGRAPYPNNEDDRPVVAIYRSVDGGDTWLEPLRVARRRDTGPGFTARVIDHGRWYFGPGQAPTGIELDPHRDGVGYSHDAFGIYRWSGLFDERAVAEPFMQGAENIVSIVFATPPAPAAPVFTGVSDVRGFVHRDVFEEPHTIIQAPGEFATYVNGLDYCEANPRVLWACKFAFRNRSIVIRTTDGGANWKIVTNPLKGSNHGGAKIAASATDPDRAVFFPGLEHGPFWTGDGGETWQPAKTADGRRAPDFGKVSFAYNFSSNVAADRVDGNTFYAYREQGGMFWSSRDGGRTWSPTCDLPDANPRDDQSPVMVEAMPGRAGEVWVALGGDGLFRSRDYGASFERVPEFSGSRPLVFAFGAPAPGRDNAAIYVFGAATGDPELALYRSIDDGASWQKIPTELYPNYRPVCFAADRQTFGRVFFGRFGIYMLQINDHDPEIRGPGQMSARVGEPNRAVFTIADAETTPPGLMLRTVETSDPSVVPLEAVEIAETRDGRREVSVTPESVGTATVTLVLADGDYPGARRVTQSLEVTAR